jgi:hypothetical protein
MLLLLFQQVSGGGGVVEQGGSGLSLVAKPTVLLLSCTACLPASAEEAFLSFLVPDSEG